MLNLGHSSSRSAGLSPMAWQLACCAMALLLTTGPVCNGKKRLTYAAVKANERFRDIKQSLDGSSQDLVTDTRATAVDHFGVAQYTGNNTFLQQYSLILPKQPLNASTPIFLFTSTEASLEDAGVGSGYYSDLADTLGAVQLWPEHRYYGSEEYSPPDSNYEHLTIEQALADQMELVLHVQLNYGLDRAPVVAIGASYSGQQAAWMRVRYPDVIAGAISSSPTFIGAPGLGLDPSYDAYGYAKVATRTASSLAGAAAACPVNVQNFFKTIFAMAKTGSGLQDLNNQLNICEGSEMKTAEDVNSTLAAYVRHRWTHAAMYNYPFALPGYGSEETPPFQVRAACKALAEPSLEGANLLKAMLKALSVFYPMSSCFHVPSDFTIPSSTFDYQICTQDYTAVSYDGVSDMFYDLPYNLDATSEICEEAFGVSTQYDWSASTFGLSAIRQSSNIFFTAGIFDPYTACSPTSNISATITAAVYEGAHGQDIGSADPAEDASVNRVREQGKQNILAWIAEYNSALASIPTSNAADLFDLNFALGGYTSIWNDTLPGSNTSRSTASLNASATITNEGI